MNTPSIRPGLVWLLLASLAVAGCSGKPRVKLPPVEIPPLIDLRYYGPVGLLTFSSGSDGALPEAATQVFMQTVQRAQPGVAILELGPAEKVLRSVGHGELDFDALGAIGKKYGTDVLLVGNLELAEMRPGMQLGQMLKSMSLKADVRATLTVRLLECGTGATLWSRSAEGRENVARVHLLSGKPTGLKMDDPNDAYARLVRGLVQRVTPDFFSHWEEQ